MLLLLGLVGALRAMRPDVRGAVFDDWAEVPGLAERLIGGSH